MSKLQARQQRFVDEYLIDLNATRAAIAAGYSKRSASAAGWEVLRNPKVASEISRRQKARAERHEISADRVVEELARLAFASLGDFYTVGADGALVLDASALSDPLKATALTQIEITEKARGVKVTKIRLADKRAALVDLGRHLGLFERDTGFVADQNSEPNPEVDTRRLAMAALALLADARAKSEQEGRPPLLEMRSAPDDDTFDIDN